MSGCRINSVPAGADRKLTSQPVQCRLKTDQGERPELLQFAAGQIDGDHNALKVKIRALHQREGKSISEIARRTSLSRNTIKKWLKAPAEAAPKYRREPTPAKLAPVAATLTQALKADAFRPRHERRTARALLVQLQAQGYSGGHSRLTDLIRAWRLGEGQAVLTTAASARAGAPASAAAAAPPRRKNDRRMVPVCGADLVLCGPLMGCSWLIGGYRAGARVLGASDSDVT